MRHRSKDRTRRPAIVLALRASANEARLIRAGFAVPIATEPRPRLSLNETTQGPADPSQVDGCLHSNPADALAPMTRRADARKDER